MKIFSLFIALFFVSFGYAGEHLYINGHQRDHSNLDVPEVEVLMAQVSSYKKETPPLDCFHHLKAVRDDTVILEDDSVWKIGWWYTDVIKNWKKGDKLKMSYHGGNDVKIINMATKGLAWAVLQKNPVTQDFIARKPVRSFDIDQSGRIILNSGWIFKTHPCNWKVRDAIFLFHPAEEGEGFVLWNLTRNEMLKNSFLLGNEKEGSSESILNLEKQINSRVLGQSEATEAVKAALFNYWIGINDPNMPIGVFLFLGPTGVGKTELAKALTDQLFKNQNYLIRFDMSHFSEYHTVSRLIGSPPGYVNHEEGGQLTEAIGSKPRSVVLLDEMEKAHPVVQKMFLPVFDEGYIVDAKNRRISCTNNIFIMTSNICAQEIAVLFNKGYTADEVLKCIEPAIMNTLSPELYNRTIPIVFHSLTPELMRNLVDLMLEQVIVGLKNVRGVDLVVDESAKAYLIKNGFHPALGARPLKRLIQKQVVANLSYAIVLDSIPEESQVTLFYSEKKDEWHVSWERL
jgi:hypothetical protein